MDIYNPKIEDFSESDQDMINCHLETNRPWFVVIRADEKVNNSKPALWTGHKSEDDAYNTAGLFNLNTGNAKNGKFAIVAHHTDLTE